MLAARRLLNREGMEAVTMRRVAEAIGITAMALYRHYPNRAGLMNALAEGGFSELTALLEGSDLSGGIEARLMKMLELYLDHALENPRLFELMFLYQRAGARRYPKDFKAGDSPTANLLVRVVCEGMESGRLRQDDAWEIVFAMGALSHGLIKLYLGGRTNMTASRFRIFYRESFRRYIRGIRR
jgi:AcrR family transcriptional regulator